MSKRNFAFTLAEVLITIGIVGVIAALVIPNLIGAQDMAVSKTKFKKTLATLNEAGKLAKAQYGYNYSDLNNGCGAAYPPNLDNPETSTSYCGIFNGTIKNFTWKGWTTNIKTENGKIYRIEKSSNTEFLNSRYVYILQDGTIFATGSSPSQNCHLELGETLDEEWISNHMECIGFIDTNGINPPNKEVSCSDGNPTALAPEKNCSVKKDTKYITDIYPIVFHDSTVEPATNAAKAILNQ